MIATERSTLTLRKPPLGVSRKVVVPVRVVGGARAAQPSDGLLHSQNLLQGQKVVSIAHNGETYQLRATRHGKLILTK